jgi:hypothetical protein
MTIQRRDKHPDEFAPIVDASVATHRLGSIPRHTNLEYLCDHTLTRVYLDYDHYEPKEALHGNNDAMRAAYRSCLKLVTDRANTVKSELAGIAPTCDFSLAARTPGVDPKHPDKIKFSFRVFFQGLAMPYTKIPQLLKMVGHDKFWDMTPYSASEQLLAGIFGIKNTADNRVLLPINDEGRPLVCSACWTSGKLGCKDCIAKVDPLPYTAQFIDPAWPTWMMEEVDMLADMPASSSTAPAPAASTSSATGAPSTGASTVQTSPAATPGTPGPTTSADLLAPNPQIVRALLQCISPARWDHRGSWVKMALMLFNLGGGTDLFYQDFVEGSKTSSKFTEEACRTLWGTLKPCGPSVKPLAIGSLYHYAQQDDPELYNKTIKDIEALADEMAISVDKLCSVGWRVEEYSERYCKDLPLDEFSMALVQAHLGTGKTEITIKAIQFLMRTRSGILRILVISPRYLYTIAVKER